ncbi:kinase non-catalytic C-lobe domain-containing protein 1 [Corythoichthys intestinalis]|uniref:kinase non-catalytic C-lobe domain-containing protein 1 n=1 Tax=Corythoichthys intestinalis TaxID=161448 RepID=UPI0025A5D7C2|nr:kinase non-catalytic C-lobe domain-containing protein 1 [Corythoichthys intestinalis]
METSWRDAYNEMDHLPPLLEDEENVSLADILTLQDSCLSEEDVWAVCAECVLALQSIRPSHLFHTLCITPDTLAFNAHGNVCFMEQVSDDPEGLFVPPEFDSTGSTFEGHVFSLGSTLSAALNFVIEPELRAELGEVIQKLLEKMQEKKPEDRPLIKDILYQAQARLHHTSSAAVCRKLSSVGRRVLSIESISNFQDGQESCEAIWQHSESQRQISFDMSKEPSVKTSMKANGLPRQQVCVGWDSSLWAEDANISDRCCMGLADELECCSHNTSPLRMRAHQRFIKAKGALNRSCSIPDSNNPPCSSFPHGNITIPVSDLTEIEADQRFCSKSVQSSRSKRVTRGRSLESYPRRIADDCVSSITDYSTSRGKKEDAGKSSWYKESHFQECHKNSLKEESQNVASSCTSASRNRVDVEHDTLGAQKSSKNHKLYIPKNVMTKSMLFLSEECTHEWIPLRELLAHCGLGLTVNELWALCYTCLSSLQTYIDFPACISLDNVYIGCTGEILFLTPKNIESQDKFYLAPEYQEHGIVTEKACVYGVAAILWATAKFTLLPNQKLVMPRKLKRLLLEMAKNAPVERPSIAMAKQSCFDYLTRQGTNAQNVWNQLISRVHAPVSRSTGEYLSADDTNQSFSTDTSHMRPAIQATVDSNTQKSTVPKPHFSPQTSHEFHTTFIVQFKYYCIPPVPVDFSLFCSSMTHSFSFHCPCDSVSCLCFSSLAHLCTLLLRCDIDMDGSDAGLTEGGDHLAKPSDESPSEAECHSKEKETLPDICGEQMSPNCLEEMEDSDSLVSEQFISSGCSVDGPDLYFRPAWDLAFFGEECFSPEVIQYASSLGQYSGLPCLDVKTQELQQQLIIETRNLKKMRNFYQKLIQQERKNQGFENKGMLSKLKAELEELRSKVILLNYVKKYLETQSVDQWGLDTSLLPSLSTCGMNSIAVKSSEETPVLSFTTHKGKKNLHAGTPLGLMAYLYAKNAASEGYIQQFLYTYRFFCTSEQLLQFIMETFITAVRECPDKSENSVNILHRSLDLLYMWIMDCKIVDFTPKSNVVAVLENFLRTVVIPADSRGQVLLTALQSPPSKIWSLRKRSEIEYEAESFCVQSSDEDHMRKWKISSGVEPSASLPKEKDFSISAALPLPCYISNPYSSDEHISFSQKNCSILNVAQQLTLLQQDIFHGCHPVHFLNSRIQGIRDKPSKGNNSGSKQIPPVESSSLPHDGMSSESYLQQLIGYSDSVIKWISGEIVICDSVKEQVALLTKYLCIGKHCYESRDFATAMQVLGGLENVIVRKLPAWKHLSSKMLEILEELRAVQVFLKSDDCCLITGEHKRRRPTLPSAQILAMHVQQREIGAFTVTSGAVKWTKLRSIAKVVSQVHAFQEVIFNYNPDRNMQAYLRHRISQLGNSDIQLQSAAHDAESQLSTERETRRVQDTLKKVKASLQ